MNAAIPWWRKAGLALMLATGAVDAQQAGNRGLSPIISFFLKEKREVGLTGKVQLVEAPAHGSLQRIPDDPE